MEGCKMVKPYLNQVGGDVDNDVSLFNGGLNTYVDKGFLEADQMPYVMNMAVYTPPKLSTRKARKTLANWMENNEWASNIGAIVDLFAYDEHQIYAIVDQGGLRKIVEIYHKEYDGQLTTTYTTRVFEVDGEPLTIPDEDKYYFTIARTAENSWIYITGLTFKVKISVNHNPIFAQAEKIEDNHYGICCCHKGRLFLGMPDSNIVTFSAAFDYDNFAEAVQYQVATSMQDMVDENIVYLMDSLNDREWNKWVWDEDQQTFDIDGTIAKTELVIDTTTGLSIPDYSVIAGDFKITNAVGRLVALKSFDDKLNIFCEHSMHVMYGDTPDVTRQNQYQLVDLNNNLGALCERCIAIGGGRLFFLGDNHEVYEYTGSALNLISRPSSSRYTLVSTGGISGVIEAKDVAPIPVDYGLSHSKFVATSERLYINIWNKQRTDSEKLLFVFDMYNRTWWCEDGEFNTIGNYSEYNNKILFGLNNGDILVNNQEGGNDEVYEFYDNTIEEKIIEYEFHTRVYGADGTDSRKTLSDVKLQARANADVYINDIWTSLDRWNNSITTDQNLVKIGTLIGPEEENGYQPPTQKTMYRPETYEQQMCVVPKMYGQRLNVFQIVVKGKGISLFYQMKREWRNSENVR